MTGLDKARLKVYLAFLRKQQAPASLILKAKAQLERYNNTRG